MLRGGAHEELEVALARVALGKGGREADALLGVLEALGVRRTTGVARISFGEETTAEDLPVMVAALARTVERYALP